MGNVETNQKARRAQERREAIIDRLGRKCVDCGTKGTKKNKLEVDHKEPRDWGLRKYSQLGRVRIYEAEELAGKLQVLCATCNKKKGNRLPTKPLSAAHTPVQKALEAETRATGTA